MEEMLHACFLEPDGKPAGTAQRFCPERAEAVRRFHASVPGYGVTALVKLEVLAHKLGIAALQVKDESSRFGLCAFKALGGSYCAARWLAERVGIPEEKLTCDRLRACAEKGAFAGLHVITATDGNHGRGVAWACRMLGIGCTVYLPKGTAQERLDNILAQKADAKILNLCYDDAVRYAAGEAAEKGWLLMQDTVVAGREEIPLLLMQGYTTMGEEIREQWTGDAPTHIFLQAGVGSMAGAMAAYFRAVYGETVKIIVVESEKADCLYRTAQADDGALHNAEGEMDTIMAGLACGEPCSAAWELLRSTAMCYLAVSDEVTKLGMRRLARPLGADKAIESGESGAVTTGTVIALMERPEYAPIREKLGLGTSSRVLCISTEGATDRKNYEKVLREAKI